jgi:hypothetical protein
MKTSGTYILLLQGLYYILTGIWALVDIESFMQVSGPKTDIWLVKTFSALIVAVGAGFLISFFSEQITYSVLFLALLSSLALGIADLYYSLNNIIRKIYLADALIEFLIFFLLLRLLNNVLYSRRSVAKN